MKLTRDGLKEMSAWREAGYSLPSFDFEKVALATKEQPRWIHFGAGNIFRAFQANVLQDLLNRGVCDTGLIAVEGFDYAIIDQMYQPHDNLGILVTLKADGSMEKTVVGSIKESYVLDSEREPDFGRLKEIFRNPSLQMASFTITEKGYSLVNGKGDILPDVAADFVGGPGAACSYMGKVTALVYERYLAGRLPLALVSMDNCSGNGEKLQQAVTAFATKWVENGLAEDGFLLYLKDPKMVGFPFTMIDKITPRPDAKVLNLLEKDEIENLDCVITPKNTYVAPFVNAEECEYLIIEDWFPNGKLPLDKGGMIYTDLETVTKVERMKVCTCLNPLHTALAVFGCLLGYDLIADEMKNPTLKKMVEIIGYQEGLPVVTDPGILHPKDFLKEVLEVRIPNPFMPDTPQRIATDTSQKLPIRFGETIKAYQASSTLRVEDLHIIPLVFAGWLRYLMAVDDTGAPFTPSPDPLLPTLLPILQDIQLGTTADPEPLLRPLLQNAAIFGVDLYAYQLAPQVLSYFREMIAGPGAVKSTMEKYVILSS
jgi:fructuronate reductase